jgi:hypothetical protein
MPPPSNYNYECHLDSLSICAYIVKADLVERSLYRAELFQGQTIDDLILNEIGDLQRDLLGVKDP